MSALEGHDRYSGSSRRVTVDQDQAHVTLTVQAYDGDGEVMLTPAQARTIAAYLLYEADVAEVDAAPVDPDTRAEVNAALEQLRARLAGSGAVAAPKPPSRIEQWRREVEDGADPRTL